MNKPFRYTLSACLLGLGAVTTASAGGFIPASSCPTVGIPCARSAWDLGLEALYAQAMNDDLSFQEDVSLQQPNFPSLVRYVHPKYKWGYKLIGSYHFNTGNDLTLAYMHYKSKSAEIAKRTLDGGLIGDPDLIETVGGASFELDNLTLEGGQKYNVGDRVTVRGHIGGQYARIRHSLTTTNGGVGDDPLSVLFGDSVPNDKHSEFRGAGFRAGVDTNYRFYDQFSLVASGAASILVGDMKVRVRTGEPFNISQNEDSHDSFRAVVPSVEARGGVRYEHMADTGTFSAEVGYFQQGFFHAIVHGQDGIYNFNDGRNHVSNFGLHGLYLQGKLLINSQALRRAPRQSLASAEDQRERSAHSVAEVKRQHNSLTLRTADITSSDASV